MLHAIIILFSFFGLTYAIKETSLFNRLRIFLLGIHAFFYELLNCFLCTGFWAGLIVFVIDRWLGWPGQLMLWGLASAAVSYITSIVLDKLQS